MGFFDGMFFIESNQIFTIVSFLLGLISFFIEIIIFFNRKIAKERYYALQKAEKRALRLERLEEIQTKIDAGLWTTTDFRNSFVRKTTKTDERHFFRDRLASAVINNNPSIVFDFRYEHYFDRPNLMASLYRQYIEVISKNR
jgi:hypothetical protein